jgi:hypothetical protein
MSRVETFPGKFLLDIEDSPFGLAALSSHKINGYAGGAYFDLAETRTSDEERVVLFRTELVVPPEPKVRDSQVNFIFNGLQTRHEEEEDKAILQPVLTWRTGGWFVSSYYVNGMPDKPKEIRVIANTRPVQVQSGDKLVGLMTSSTSKWGYYYSCEFDGIGGTGLEIVSRLDLCKAIVALESYAVNACEELPGSKIQFINLELESPQGRIKPAWNKVISTKECNIDVNIEVAGGSDRISIGSCTSS